MNKLAYIVAEVAALYCVTVALLLGFIWLTTGFGLVGLCLAVLAAVAALPFAIRGATIGFRGENSLGAAVAYGFYKPIRLIAMVMPAVAAMQADDDGSHSGQREPMAFDLTAMAGLRPYDALARLAAYLEALGVPHTSRGGIDVRDNGVTWRLYPVAGQNALEGWVEGPDATIRQQVIAGIDDFLIGLHGPAAA